MQVTGPPRHGMVCISRVPLLPLAILENATKSNEIQRKINENLETRLENHWKSIKTSVKVIRNQEKSTKKHRKSTRIDEHNRKSTEIQ